MLVSPGWYSPQWAIWSSTTLFPLALSPTHLCSFSNQDMQEPQAHPQPLSSSLRSFRLLELLVFTTQLTFYWLRFSHPIHSSVFSLESVCAVVIVTWPRVTLLHEHTLTWVYPRLQQKQHLTYPMHFQSQNNGL